MIIKYPTNTAILTDIMKNENVNKNLLPKESTVNTENTEPTTDIMPIRTVAIFGGIEE